MMAWCVQYEKLDTPQHLVVACAVDAFLLDGVADHHALCVHHAQRLLQHFTLARRFVHVRVLSAPHNRVSAAKEWGLLCKRGYTF